MMLGGGLFMALGLVTMLLVLALPFLFAAALVVLVLRRNQVSDEK